MLHKRGFWVRHVFENYLWKLYFPKNYCIVTLNVYDYLWKVHHIWYYIWENAWIVDMENMRIFYIIFDNKSWILWYIGKFKDAYLSCLILFGKLIENLVDKEWSWKPHKLYGSFDYLKFFLKLPRYKLCIWQYM